MRVWVVLAVLGIICGQGSAVTIYGSVSCEGAAAAYVHVLALDVESGQILASDADASDNQFQLDVPAHRDVMVLAFPSSGRQVENYQALEYLVAIRTVSVGEADLQLELQTMPAVQFIFQGESEGRLLDETDYTVMFCLDSNEEAMQLIPIGARHLPTNTASPSFNVLPGMPVTFLVEWSLPHAGRLLLPMECAGEGFVADQPGTVVLNVNQEIARTAIFRLETAVNGADDPGTAVTALNQARDLFQAGEYDESAGRAMVALENLVLRRARERIPELRTGTLNLHVQDASGHPVPDATVHIEMQARDFNFGFFDTVAATGIDAMARARDAGFDFFTAGIYWSESEPQDDAFQWEYLDHQVGMVPVSEMGFRIKAHPLIWLIDLAMPEYLRQLSLDPLAQEIDEHVETLVERYAPIVSAWDVINEAHGSAAAGGLTRDQITVVTRRALEQVQALDPTADTLVNSAFDWFGQSIIYELYDPARATPFAMALPAYIEDLLAHGASMDVIGQQMYNCGCVTLFSELGLADQPTAIPMMDLAMLDTMLTRLDAFQLPFHITEHSIPSEVPEECPDSGYWRAPWSPQVQADYAQAFYTLVFSHASAEAITWWNLVDPHAFVNHGALMNDQAQPKPVMNRLSQQFASWSTNATVQTDARGDVELQVFGGTYRVQLESDGVIVEDTMHVPERTQQHRVFTLSSDPTPLWIPHIALSQAWRTRLILDNPKDEGMTAQVTQWDETGEAHVMQAEIPAQTQISFPLEAGSCGRLHTSNAELQAHVLYESRNTGACAQLPLDAVIHTSLHVLLPYQAAADLDWCGVALFNPHDQAVDVSIEALDAQGEPVGSHKLGIQPHRRIVADISAWFGDLSWRRISRLLVSCDVGLSGIMVAGQGHDYLLFSRAVAPNSRTSFPLTHLAADRQTWTNVLAVDSVTESDVNFRIQFFREGQMVCTEQGTLAAKHAQVLDLDGMCAEADFAMCEADQPGLHVRQSFRHVQGAWASFHVNQDPQTRLMASLSADLAHAPDWQGVVLSNPGNLQRHAWVTLRSQNGEAHGFRLQLRPHQRWKALLRDVAPDLVGAIVQVSVESSGPMHALRLSGWNDGRLVGDVAHSR